MVELLRRRQPVIPLRLLHPLFRRQLPCLAVQEHIAIGIQGGGIRRLAGRCPLEVMGRLFQITLHHILSMGAAGLIFHHEFHAHIIEARQIAGGDHILPSHPPQGEKEIDAGGLIAVAGQVILLHLPLHVDLSKGLLLPGLLGTAPLPQMGLHDLVQDRGQQHAVRRFGLR